MAGRPSELDSLDLLVDGGFTFVVVVQPCKALRTIVQLGNSRQLALNLQREQDEISKT